MVLLTADTVGERTQDHPESVLSRARHSRDIALLFVALLLPSTGFLWWLSRREVRNEQSRQ